MIYLRITLLLAILSTLLFAPYEKIMAHLTKVFYSEQIPEVTHYYTYSPYKGVQLIGTQASLALKTPKDSVENSVYIANNAEDTSTSQLIELQESKAKAATLGQFEKLLKDPSPKATLLILKDNEAPSKLHLDLKNTILNKKEQPTTLDLQLNQEGLQETENDSEPAILLMQDP